MGFFSRHKIHLKYKHLNYPPNVKCCINTPRAVQTTMRELIDKEIKRLSSELCALVDQEILFLQSRDRGLNVLTIEEIAIKALRENPWGVLTYETAVPFIRRNYPAQYYNAIRGLNISEKNLNEKLENAIFCIWRLDSQINYINRLKKSNLIQLNDTLKFLKTPTTSELSDEFDSTSESWINIWKANEGKKGSEAPTQRQTEACGLCTAFQNWISHIKSPKINEHPTTMRGWFMDNMQPFQKLAVQLSKIEKGLLKPYTPAEPPAAP